jgi:hypothetical protein
MRDRRRVNDEEESVLDSKQQPSLVDGGGKLTESTDSSRVRSRPGGRGGKRGSSQRGRGDSRRGALNANVTPGNIAAAVVSEKQPPAGAPETTSWADSVSDVGRVENWDSANSQQVTGTAFVANASSQPSTKGPKPASKAQRSTRGKLPNKETAPATGSSQVILFSMDF